MNLMYGIRLSHIFKITSISNEKLNTENLEFRLNNRYREYYYVPWLFLFVTNIWTVTKRPSMGLKK